MSESFHPPGQQWSLYKMNGSANLTSGNKFCPGTLKTNLVENLFRNYSLLHFINTNWNLEDMPGIPALKDFQLQRQLFAKQPLVYNIFNRNESQINNSYFV